MKKKRILTSLLAGLLTWLALPGPAGADLAPFQSVMASPRDSYVLLLVQRSAAYLDWSNPSALARTTVQSLLKKRLEGRATSIGHAQLAWSCRSDFGLVLDGATGQVGEEHNQGLALLQQGWGLNLLNTVYTDGSLETAEGVAERVRLADSQGDLAWIALRVPFKPCLELVKYIQAYRDSGAAVNYGFPVDPLKFEGAGCTSFAQAALTKLQLGLPLRETWVRHVRLPQKYLGRMASAPPLTRPPQPARTPAEVRHVPLQDFFLQELQWAAEGEAAHDFYYYDPELFFVSLVQLENQYRQQRGLSPKPALRAPEDAAQAAARQAAESWFQQLQAQQRLEAAQVFATTGLIVDLR